MQAIYERAYRLGLVKPDERAGFYRSLNAKGWKVREPASDELAPELPELARQIAVSMRERGLSDAEIANLAGFVQGVDDNPFRAHPQRLRAI